MCVAWSIWLVDHSKRAEEVGGSDQGRQGVGHNQWSTQLIVDTAGENKQLYLQLMDSCIPWMVGGLTHAHR